MKKIPTLFERRFENHNIVEVLPKITPGMEGVFKKGVATLKYDGSCCAIIDGKFYKRYDAKNGKPVPEGAIKCQSKADPITGHLPCWIRVDKNNPSDKWFIKAFENYKTKNNHINDGTFEAIGVHFQGNPYNLKGDTLVRHGDETLEVKRTFEGVKEYLFKYKIEGIVFWKDGEPKCKIKRSDFGLEWG